MARRVQVETDSIPKTRKRRKPMSAEQKAEIAAERLVKGS